MHYQIVSYVQMLPSQRDRVTIFTAVLSVVGKHVSGYLHYTVRTIALNQSCDRVKLVENVCAISLI